MIARYKIKNEMDAEAEVPEEASEEVITTYTKIKDYWGE
jgi:hypothetical protein